MDSYRQLHNYEIQIVSVKMKVKFQCRMVIQFNGQPITSEVLPSNKYVFQFNKDINLSQQPTNDYFTLNLNLVTHKGAKYIAAEAFIYYSEIIKSDGTSLTLSLSKCLDPEAKIQIKVLNIVPFQFEQDRRMKNMKDSEKTQKNDLHLSKHDEELNMRRFYSPNFGTRSQAQLGNVNIFRDNRTYCKRSNDNLKQRAKSRSELKRINSNKYSQKRLKEKDQEIMFEIKNKYKESYERLKSHMKKQSERNKSELEHKLIIQNNDLLMKMKAKNNLTCNELQVARQKLRNLEQSYEDQNRRMSMQINKLKLQSQKLALREIEEREKNYKLQTDLKNSENNLKLMMEKYDRENREWHEKYLKFQNSIQKEKDENSKLLQKVGRLSEKEHMFCHNVEQVNFQTRQYLRVIDELKYEISDYKRRIGQIEYANSMTSKENSELNDKIRRQQKQIQRLGREVKEGGMMKEKYEMKVRQLQGRVDEFRRQIREKDNRVASISTWSGEGKVRGEVKQQLLRHELKQQNMVKENRKFKEYLVQNINSILSELNMVNGSRKTNRNISVDFNFVREEKTEISNSDIINRIRHIGRQYKNRLGKLGEQCREREKQVEKYREKVEEVVSIKKIQQNNDQEDKRIYQETIQVLKSELDKINRERQVRQTKLKGEIKKQNVKLQQADGQVNKLRIVHEETCFSLDALKISKQQQLQKKNTKIKGLNKKVEKLQEQVVGMRKREKKVQEMRQDMLMQISRIVSECENVRKQIKKKDVLISEYRAEIEKQVREIQVHKADKGRKMQLILQLQMRVKGEKQGNTLCKQLLQGQQKKDAQNKQLINRLLKQKQKIIKQNAYKQESIRELTTLLESSREQKQRMTADYEQKCRQCESIRVKHRELGNSGRVLQEKVESMGSQYNIVQAKLKQKEKEYSMLQELSKSQEANSKKQIENKIREIKEYQISLQNIQNNSTHKYQQYNQQINRTLNQLQTKSNTNSTLQRQKDIALKQIEQFRKTMGQMENEMQFLRNSSREMERRVMSISRKVEEIEEDLSAKEDELYETQQKCYNLQTKLQEKQEWYRREVQKVDQQWDCKYEGMLQDFENKIEELQQQKEYYTVKNMDFEQEVGRKTERLQQLEREYSSDKILQCEKYRRMQQQKGNAMMKLKQQLQVVGKELREERQRMKKCELKMQKNSNELIGRQDTIYRLQLKIKDYEDKIQNISHTLQSQQSKYYKRELQYRKYQEDISNCKWIIEREIKKQINNSTKTILSQLEHQEDKRTIMEAIRELEKTLTNLVQNKISQTKNT